MAAAVNRETGMARVSGTAPVGCRMALRAVLRKSLGSMIGVRCVVVLLEVTIHTVCRRARKTPALMAVHAVERCVRARKGKSGKAAVVESGEPTVHAVAYFAIQRKTTPLMIDRRLDIIVVMAEIAVGPQSPEQADSRACMAVLAFQGRVRPHEWKPVRVPIYCSLDFEPAANRMTLFAVWP